MDGGSVQGIELLNGTRRGSMKFVCLRLNNRAFAEMIASEVVCKTLLFQRKEALVCPLNTCGLPCRDDTKRNIAGWNSRALLEQSNIVGDMNYDSFNACGN